MIRSLGRTLDRTFFSTQTKVAHVNFKLNLHGYYANNSHEKKTKSNKYEMHAKNLCDFGTVFMRIPNNINFSRHSGQMYSLMFPYYVMRISCRYNDILKQNAVQVTGYFNSVEIFCDRLLSKI